VLLPPAAGGSSEPRAASSSASAGDPRSGGRLRADRAVPLEVGGAWHLCDADVSSLGCEALRGDGPHGGGGGVGHGPLWTTTW
jgi:hypothetical protein